jgi:hypothetical protein
MLPTKTIEEGAKTIVVFSASQLIYIHPEYATLDLINSF